MRRSLTLAALLALVLGLAFPACGSTSAPDEPNGPGGTSGAAGRPGGAAGQAGKGGAAASAGKGGSPPTAGSAVAVQGGTGQGGSSAGSGDIPAWLADDSGWEPLSIDGFDWDDCVVSHARPATLGPSGFVWSSCGVGCERLDTQWLGANGEFSSLGHVERGDRKTTLLSASWYKAPYGVRQVISLETNQVVNAIRGVSLTETETPKYGGGWTREPRFFAVSPLVDGGHTQESDLWLAEDGTLERSFLYPILKFGVYFALDADQNMGFIGHGQVRRYGFGDGAKEFDVVANGHDVRDGAGQGDLAVWLNHLSTSVMRVQGWRPNGQGTIELLDIPLDASRPSAYAYQVGLSTTRLVGTVSYALPDNPHVASDMRLWTTPRPAPGLKPVLTMSPPLLVTDETLTPAELKTWGDYALVRMANIPQGKGAYWVIHLPTWTIYVLDRVGKTRFVDRTYAIDDTYVYLGLNSEGFGSRLTHVQRWELAKLGQSATQVLHAQ
jgi:hypothetical protein